MRHVALNASLTGPYDYFHEGLFIRFGEFDFVKPTALLLAAFVSSCITLPFDNVRTRLMNLHTEADRNKVNYRGYIDTFQQAILLERTPRGLYAGFYTWMLATYVYAWLTIGIT